MVSSKVTSDGKLAESIKKYPVLYDKSCAGFREKLKKQLAWTDVAEEVGLENGVLYSMEGNKL